MATQLDVRTIVQTVRDALEYRQQLLDGRTPGQQLPLADDLATRIATGLIPSLRQIYLDMAGIKVEWQQKDFQAQLTAALASGDYIAGFPATTWVSWGVFMLALEAFLATPIAALGDATPTDALLARYIPGAKPVVIPDPIVIPPTPEPEPDPEPDPVPDPEPEPEPDPEPTPP